MKIHRLILLTVLICAFSAHVFSQSNLRAGSTAPAFNGNVVGGDPISLSGLRGKVVVMTFWTTRCAICRHEMPILDDVVKQYDPDKVVFLALTTENEHQVAAYLRNNPFSFKIVPDSFGTLLRYADRDGRGNINIGYPSFFVVDKDGLVQHRSSGYDKIAPLTAAIDRLL